MLDAFELSENLTNGKFADVKSAIAHYEKEMLVRFVKEGEDTMKNFIDLTYSPEGLQKMMELFNPISN